MKGDEKSKKGKDDFQKYQEDHLNQKPTSNTGRKVLTKRELKKKVRKRELAFLGYCLLTFI